MSEQVVKELYEVFIRAQHSSGHQHVGSLKAGGIEEAFLSARDLYTRRGEGVSIWVVLSSNIFSNNPQEEGALFLSGTNKKFRYPTYYKVPDGVKKL